MLLPQRTKSWFSKILFFDRRLQMNSRLKYFLGGCLIMSLLVIVTVPARADYTIVQTSSNGSIGNVYVGQTFTTVGYGLITQIDVRVDGMNTHCDSLQLCIFDGSQEPSDPNAAQYCETFSGFAEHNYAFWKSLELTVPFPVDSSTQIHLRSGEYGK